MLRLISAVVAGFFAWVLAWFGGEQLLSVIWPTAFGAHQRAFQAAIESGSPFTADTTMLLVHILLGSVVCVMSGFLAALIAGSNQRAPLALGFVLLAMGLLKVFMSWPYAPLWYHLAFTTMLVPMTIVGGRLRSIR